MSIEAEFFFELGTGLALHWVCPASLAKDPATEAMTRCKIQQAASCETARELVRPLDAMDEPVACLAFGPGTPRVGLCFPA
jgi:hypothetical protein